MMRVTFLAGLLILLLPLAASVSAASSLVDAVKAGDANAVRRALATEDPNKPENDGTTALHWAVRRENVQVVDILLEAGARVDSATRHGVTPLYLACEKGNAAIVERLLRAGADPNTALPDGETALMTAARAGEAAVLRVLIAHGAKVNSKEPQNEQTGLMWAASADRTDAIKVLVEAGADIHARSKVQAARRGSSGGKSGSSGAGYSAFLYAVRAGAMDAARVLLESGANVNDTLPDGSSALLVAVINAHFELAARLLESGADPNADGQGWTALHEIAYVPHINKGFEDPRAVPTGKIGYLELAHKLVEHGADINARQSQEASIPGRQMMNRIGATPFLLAAKHADVPLMRTLLDLGADPMLTTVELDTPLMAAAGVGISGVGENAGTNEEALEAAKLVLSLGDDVAKVNAINAIGLTAMHGAAIRGATGIVQLLADHGFDGWAVRSKPDRRFWGPLRYDYVTGYWTPLELADGVIYSDAFKAHPAVAALIRKTLKERGLPVPQQTYNPGVPVRPEEADSSRIQKINLSNSSPSGPGQPN